MAAFPRTCGFLGESTLGVFGAGHLGRTIARCLLQSGFPGARLRICHGQSTETQGRLSEQGLSAHVVDPNELTRSSRIILYLVRPQNASAIASHAVRADSLMVSFLAGVPLFRLQVAAGERVRVMPSAPATIMARQAIAGVFPSGNPVVRELLHEMGIREVALQKEDDVHAFTAFGPCLPIALCLWRARGGEADDGHITERAQAFGLGGYTKVLEWAHSVEPVFHTDAERAEYLRAASTPGGVTEAILRVIQSGGSLTEALEAGIKRSRELSP